MNVVESTWHSRVQDIVEELAGGLAAGKDVRIRKRIQALADDLLREMLRAVCGASAREIADAISALGGTRSERTAAQRAFEQSNGGGRLNSVSLLAMAGRGGSAGIETPDRRGRDGALRDDRPSPPVSHADDPFDITMPSELLASTDETKPARAAGSEAGRETSAARSEPRMLPRLLSGPARVPAAAEDSEAESERRPRVVLREGERLLKGTGSGVVIRRERRVKP